MFSFVHCMKNRLLINILKFIIVIISYGYIAHKLYEYKNPEEIIALFLTFDIAKFVIISVVFILMFFNWGVESLKWRYLVAKLEKISLLQSMKAILAGITVSIFTPNRIGEFGGRILVLKKENRISAISSTLIGNLGQLLITIVAGLFATILLLYSKHSFNNINILISIGAILAVILFFIFFNLDKTLLFLLRFSFFRKHKEKIDVIALYSKKELLIILFLCFFRYLIFTTQFYIILIFLGVEIGFVSAYISIALAFLVMAIIPTTGFIEVGVRGSVALFFIGMFANQSVGIFSATLLLWVINLAIPAVIGSYFMIKFKM